MRKLVPGASARRGLSRAPAVLPHSQPQAPTSTPFAPWRRRECAQLPVPTHLSRAATQQSNPEA
jgi:hypothetical protein